MFRFDDSAEEVDLEKRLAKAVPVHQKKRTNAKKTVPKAPRSQDPLGTDAKNYNDEISDPDLVIPE